MLNVSQKHKNVSTIYISPPNWHDTGSWNTSSYTTRTYRFYIVNTMSSDALATQGDRASATGIIPASHTEDWVLTCCTKCVDTSTTTITTTITTITTTTTTTTTVTAANNSPMIFNIQLRVSPHSSSLSLSFSLTLTLSLLSLSIYIYTYIHTWTHILSSDGAWPSY